MRFETINEIESRLAWHADLIGLDFLCLILVAETDVAVAVAVGVYKAVVSVVIAFIMHINMHALMFK